MTVRQRLALVKSLSKPVKVLRAKSNTVGELQIQVIVDGKQEVVFLPSSTGKDLWIDLLAVAPVDAWKKSTSLLNSVRLGHVTIDLEHS